MYQTRSLTKFPEVKKNIVLSSRSANAENLQSSLVVCLVTKAKELSNRNLRNRNLKNELKLINQDKSEKDGLNRLKANDKKKSKQDIQTTEKENIYQKNKTNNGKKLQNKVKVALNKNVNQYASDSVSKQCKSNDTLPLLQKRKKRKIDIYDIAEDEDLKIEELTNKVENKQIVRKKCNIKLYKKLTLKPKIKRNILNAKENLTLSVNKISSGKDMLIKDNRLNSDQNIFKGKAISKLNLKNQSSKCLNSSGKDMLIKDNRLNSDQSIFKGKAISKLNLKNQSSKCVNSVEKHNQIHSFDKIDSIDDSLSCKTQQLLKTLEKSEISNKNIPVNISDLDLSRPMPYELTPVKESVSESRKSLFLESVSNDLNECETYCLIPKMTSTPESQSPMAPAYTFPIKSFDARMSEIPLLPSKRTDVVDIASAEELLNAEMQNVRSIEVSLFESPPKVECHKQINNSKIEPKELQMSLECENSQQPLITVIDNDLELVNPYVENHTCSLDNVDSDVNEQDMLLFGTPPKLHSMYKSKKSKELAEGLSRIKLNKSRKSYDNRYQNKKLVSRGTKKKTAAMKKEEELIKSLNEHFSELENFELCLE